MFNLCVFVGGTPVLADAESFFWFVTAYGSSAQPQFVKDIFPAPVYYVSLALWAFGNFLLWYLTVLTAVMPERKGWCWQRSSYPSIGS